MGTANPLAKYISIATQHNTFSVDDLMKQFKQEGINASISQTRAAINNLLLQAIIERKDIESYKLINLSIASIVKEHDNEVSLKNNLLKETIQWLKLSSNPVDL